MAVTITAGNFSSSDAGFSIGDLGTEATAAFTRASDSAPIHLFKRTLDTRQFPLRGTSWQTGGASYYSPNATTTSYTDAEYRSTDFPVHYFEERIVQIGASGATTIYPFQLPNYSVGVEFFWFEVLATFYSGNTYSQSYAFTMKGQFEKEGSTYTGRDLTESFTAYDYISNTALDADNVVINTSPPSISLSPSFNASGTNRTIWNVYGFSVLTIA